MMLQNYALKLQRYFDAKNCIHLVQINIQKYIGYKRLISYSRCFQKLVSICTVITKTKEIKSECNGIKRTLAIPNYHYKTIKIQSGFVKDMKYYYKTQNS